MTDGRPLTAAEPSLPGRKVVALDVDDPVFVERNLQQFIDGLVVAEAVEREGEQPLVYVEAHQAGCHVDADKAGVHFLAPQQRSEVRRIVART